MTSDNTPSASSPGHTYPEVTVRGTPNSMETETRSPSSPGGGAPLRSPRSPTDGRLRARLEASSVGLEELNLLRQNQCRAIEMVKAMLMANIPEEGLNQADQPLEQPSVMKGDLMETISIGASASDSPVTEQHPGGGCQQESVTVHLEAPEDVSCCRKRASSMDISMARSLALKAKKLRGHTAAAPPVSYNRNHQATTRRTRSSSFSVEPPLGATKQAEQNLKKGQSMTTLSINREGRQKQGSDRHHDLENCGPTRNSLSGSFLSLGSPHSPRSRSLQTAAEEPLTEKDFDSHFRSARSLSGSKLAYEFPSPMHAILLHYDKTDSPVLKDEGTAKCNCDEDGKIRMRRASFSGPVGRRSPRQEISYKLRKDSSLGDLPISGAFGASASKGVQICAKDKNNDEGVSAFIEMLANRGLARKRQGVLERKQRMIDALESTNQADGMDFSVENSTSDELSNSLRSTSDESGDNDISKTEHSQSLDADSGQWEGSNLSSSGKRGSHISIRSSTSSKASLSSEEGYFSHPGSPQNKHTNNRFSIQSASSLTSSGNVSLYQSEYSDEDLLDSPQGKLQEWTIPESPSSTDTLTPSNSGSIEILNLQQSPGAKRRHSTSVLCVSKGNGSIQGDLPRTSTPLKDLAMSPPVSKVELNQIQTETVKITITRAKSSSPINIVSKQKSTRRDSSSSPKTSFSCNFDGQVSSSCSPKDSVDSSSSPNGKKDSPSWGKLLPDAPRVLSQWRQTNPKSDSPGNGSTKSRFECPRTPTIQEEPKMEEEFTERQLQTPKAPALLQLSISPARDNVVMLSPQICNAPKVPSWRKHPKIVVTTDENTPLSTTEQYKNKSEPGITLESKQSTKKINPLEEGPKGSDLKVEDTSDVDTDENKKKCEAVAGAVSQMGKQQRRHSKQKCDNSTMAVVSTAFKADTGKTVPANLVIKKENSPTQTTTNKPIAKDSRQRGSSSAKAQLQPTPGREYISRTPKSDTTNVFQYPSVVGNSLATTPKTPSSRDIHELLRDWVEARTPTLPPGTTESKGDNVQAPQCSTLPRGFRTLAHQPLTHSPSEARVKDNTDTLRRSKRMFHSQELCPKAGQGQLTPHIKITAVQSNKRVGHILNENISGKNRDLPERNIAKQQKINENKLQKRDSSPPSSSPQPRPRSQTWSRGQQPQHINRNSKDTWVRETIVPPSTPTCKVEARLYGGRTIKPRSSHVSENSKEPSQPKLQWYRTCTEIKDTFV